MAPRLLKPVLCWICLCSVHSQDTPLGGSVMGPDFLVTNWNWTRQLNLTCQAPDALTVTRYTWFTPAYDTKRCNTNQSTCTFQPRLEDDNQTVTCRVAYLANNATRAVYQVNLKYPPPSRPVITTRSPQTNAVKQGDVITCTVTGGKPSVTNVTFHCQHPDHADREDDVSDDGTTVNSSITVNPSKASNQRMLCICSAYWDPEPGLYNETTNTEFILNFSESSPDDNDPLSPAVVGGVIGAVVVVVVAIAIIAVVMWKYCRRKQINSRQNATVGENPQTTRQQQRERRPQQLAEHVDIGNPYDVLQPGQDDGRTYTELMTSSTADDGTYLHPVNDDYEIPVSR